MPLTCLDRRFIPGCGVQTEGGGGELPRLRGLWRVGQAFPMGASRGCYQRGRRDSANLSGSRAQHSPPGLARGWPWGRNLHDSDQ